uniref:Beta-N-acetylhexosaminidase n=1 Tax=Desulfobacca acetoxidans TaxID=60893 RepID=A0A7C5AMP0_9BACT
MAPGNARDEVGFFGRLLMVGLPGPRVDKVARELVRELRVAGFIFFARNLEGPEQVWHLTRELQKEALFLGDLPLLLAVDQEGGPVQRLKAPFTIIPAARKLGASATPDEVRLLAKTVARELALVGLNMNLAPVLDVARGPECPQWERSFGPEPERVAAFGVGALQGYRAGGVIPVAKHFPGLGDTDRDSHEVLPTAQNPDPCRETDLFPFRRALAAGAPAVMTAHLKVPAWDIRPATLSQVALTDWLRRRLGFQGVIMTDDLEMGAIARDWPLFEAACQALAAGADLLLICNNWQAAFDTGERLRKETKLADRAQEAAARLARLRKSISPVLPDLKTIREYFARPTQPPAP